jgi:hypothetical protein
VTLRRNRDLELGAHAVGGGNQDGVLETRRARVEEPAESTQRRVCAWARGGRGQRFDQVDEAVAGIDIDPRVAVGQAVFCGIASYGFLAG